MKRLMHDAPWFECPFGDDECDKLEINPKLLQATEGRYFEMRYMDTDIYIQVKIGFQTCRHFTTSLKAYKYSMCWGRLVSKFELKLDDNRDFWLTNVRLTCIQAWKEDHLPQERVFVRWLDKDEHLGIDVYNLHNHMLFQIACLTNIIRDYSRPF